MRYASGEEKLPRQSWPQEFLPFASLDKNLGKLTMCFSLLDSARSAQKLTKLVLKVKKSCLDGKEKVNKYFISLMCLAAGLERLVSCEAPEKTLIKILYCGPVAGRVP